MKIKIMKKARTLDDSNETLVFPNDDIDESVLSGLLMDCFSQRIPFAARIKVTYKERKPWFDSWGHDAAYWYPRRIVTRNTLEEMYFDLHDQKYSIEADDERFETNQQFIRNQAEAINIGPYMNLQAKIINGESSPFNVCSF